MLKLTLKYHKLTQEQTGKHVSFSQNDVKSEFCCAAAKAVIRIEKDLKSMSFGYSNMDNMEHKIYCSGTVMNNEMFFINIFLPHMSFDKINMTTEKFNIKMY